MKLLYFDDFKLGVLNAQGEVVDVMPIVENIPHWHRGDIIRTVIERWDDYRPRLEAAAKGAGVPLSQ